MGAVFDYSSSGARAQPSWSLSHGHAVVSFSTPMVQTKFIGADTAMALRSCVLPGTVGHDRLIPYNHFTSTASR